jgi:hypothetical protein
VERADPERRPLREGPAHAADPLLGRPAERFIAMPGNVTSDVLEKLIQRPIRNGFPDLDLIGLPAAFPFGDSDLRQLEAEPSIRGNLIALAKRYNEVVYREAPPRWI